MLEIIAAESGKPPSGTMIVIQFPGKIFVFRKGEHAPITVVASVTFVDVDKRPQEVEFVVVFVLDIINPEREEGINAVWIFGGERVIVMPVEWECDEVGCSFFPSGFFSPKKRKDVISSFFLAIDFEM